MLSNHPIWDVLSKIAAPGALAAGATLYLTGYTFQAALLRNFGIAGNIVSPSVQEVLAQGYPFVLIASLLILVLALIIRLLAFVLKLALRKSPKYTSLFQTLFSLGTIMQNARYLVLGVLCIGFFAGGFGGIITAKNFKRLLKNGCQSSCYYYHTRRGTITGFVLLQDKDRAIIAGRNTAYVVANSDILSAKAVEGKVFLRNWR
jgi:hypothetical protein